MRQRKIHHDRAVPMSLICNIVLVPIVLLNLYVRQIQPGIVITWSNITHLSWWRHQMETFAALLVLCAENSPVTGEFPAQMPVTRGFDVSLICAWINSWVNNREAGDFRRHIAHYDVSLVWIPHHTDEGRSLAKIWIEKIYPKSRPHGRVCCKIIVKKMHCVITTP